jgi:ATP-binding cassette subfamily B protein
VTESIAVKNDPQVAPARPKQPSVFGILGQYRRMIILLVLLAIAANVLTLYIPKLISQVIDQYISGQLILSSLALEFGAFALGIFLFTYLQSIVQAYGSERVARDVRSKLVAKISHQGYRFIESHNPSRLLTNITSDIDSIKMFVAQGVVSLVSSIVIIIGVAIILISIDWKLGLAVLAIVPFIGGTFFVVLQKVRTLFVASRGVIDWLNKVINESILGSALIRVLHTEQEEKDKFSAANARARDIGLDILRLFAFMIPIITFVANMGTLVVVSLGGYYVINGAMTLGSFAAFNSYVFMLIFPIMVIGFISNIVAQATASYGRINEVLEAPDEKAGGDVAADLTGQIDIESLSVMYGEKYSLRDVSLKIAPRSKTAIIGPTAAGKTQLVYAATGLLTPTAGSILYDGVPLAEYDRESFYQQIGLVFQDSVLFNTTVRENIAFSAAITDEALARAIETAEIDEFINKLPQGLDTLVSERGTSLSGGQKQRITLARALAQNPKILFLDDFTARVDTATERRILENLFRNYPDLTLISVTQKIAAVEKFDQIILLMEGEILARGTHEELMQTSPEYVQIFNSQRSTNAYELRT